MADKSPDEDSRVCDEKCNKLTEKTEQEVAKAVGINLKDLDNPEILTDALREEFSVAYDKSLEAFYNALSETEFSKINEALVQLEANKYLKKVMADFKVKKLMDTSNSHKVAFVESFLSGLHDSLMEICLEK